MFVRIVVFIRLYNPDGFVLYISISFFIIKIISL